MDPATALSWGLFGVAAFSLLGAYQERKNIMRLVGFVLVAAFCVYVGWTLMHS